MTHEFTYSNGVVQQKRLIKHSDYLKIKGLPETTDAEKELKEAALFAITGGKEWFTDKSPLFDAIKTAILDCNGVHSCKVIDLKKEGIYELQRIDCNCNDCVFLFRLLDRKNTAINKDKESQEEIFNITKARKIRKTENDIDNLLLNKHLIKDVDIKISAKLERLKLLKTTSFHYQGQQAEIHYGVCCKFKKEITFAPNTCQIETQKCFIHRKDISSTL